MAAQPRSSLRPEPAGGPSNSFTEGGALGGLGLRDLRLGLVGLGLEGLGLGGARTACVRASAAGTAVGGVDMAASTESGAAGGARAVHPGTALAGSAASLAAKGRMCCVKVVSDRRMSDPLPGLGPLSPSHCRGSGTGRGVSASRG